MASVEKYAVHTLVRRRDFFRDGLWRLAPGRNETDIFSRWPSLVSAWWEDRFYSDLNPVTCAVVSRAQRFHGRTTAMVTTTAVYGHAVVFPSVFLCSLHDFYFFSLSLSLFRFFPGFSVLSTACTLQTTEVRTVSAKFIVKIGCRRRHRGRCIVKIAGREA